MNIRAFPAFPTFDFSQVQLDQVEGIEEDGPVSAA
jgi:hypothetical protein